MSEEAGFGIPKAYDPHEVEGRWYAFWEAEGCFRADAADRRPAFSMAIPPPNITGSLHMGHALSYSLEDLITRYKRMSGFNALWLPGVDHAGIATQLVVERELKKEGLDRQQMGRAAFLERVWAWRERYGNRIVEQLKILGCSVDWSRERFTLDEGLSRTVRHVFVRLYREGLIYRAERLINWCPSCHTAISDLEVVHQEREGKLWTIGYRVAGSTRVLPVATTRPETLLGDTALAVHPEDPRYAGLIGHRALVPLIDREIPIVGDSLLVDREFGTGVVKITPAHDFNDFEAGRRHGLPAISIFDSHARTNENAGPYANRDRFEARKRVLADLEAMGQLLATEDHKLSLGTCQRSGDIVEPRLSKQWFVKMEPLAAPAIEAVEQGKVKFFPESWTATYFHWMRNIHDWCISRQLWWGHQIPAWYCSCGETVVAEEAPTSCPKCGRGDLTRDEDVLDTWFSSALWPFSTLGWPEQTEDLRTFYPTTLMETGSDILFFWVARMIMMGLKFTGELPFRDVFLHAIVRDAEGEKMSKTKGNVIDPLDVTREYGVDALRFALLSQSGQGRDISLSLERVATYRAFANKIWNAARFTLMNLEDFGGFPHGFTDDQAVPDASIHDRWIRSRLASAAAAVREALDLYRFADAASEVHRFLWNELCDWYIELAKSSLQGADPKARIAAQRTLVLALDGALRLLHPFMPFITEEIWQRLPRRQGDPRALAVASFPTGNWWSDREAEAEVEDVLKVAVDALRNLRGEVGIPPGKRVSAIARAVEGGWQRALRRQETAICTLAQLDRLTITGPGPRIPRAAVQIRPGFELVVPLAGVIDFAEEAKRLQKEITRAEADQKLLSGKLGNPSFVQRAPPDIVAKDRQRLDELAGKLAQLRDYFRIITEPEVIDMSSEDWKYGGGSTPMPSPAAAPSVTTPSEPMSTPTSMPEPARPAPAPSGAAPRRPAKRAPARKATAKKAAKKKPAKKVAKKKAKPAARKKAKPAKKAAKRGGRSKAAKGKRRR
jgi:valyl-tRNA synthetase